jgi:hypothetical protein
MENRRIASPSQKRGGRGAIWPVGLAVLAALLLSLASPARAQETKLIGEFRAWKAYSFMEDGEKVCYMASSPTRQEGNYTRRGPVFVLITHRPADGTKNVVNMVAGYTYKEGEPVIARIGEQTFKLYTEKERAWATDDSTDEALIRAMRGGRRMIVKGVSWRGTKTKDTYSLLGFSRAHREISKLCKVK